MLKTLVSLTLAFGAGVALVVQQALNSSLRIPLGSAAWAGFASYFVGLVSMAVLVSVLRDPLPPVSAVVKIPWWAWGGGLLGAIYIGLAIVLLPQIGAATFVALLVAGQLMASVLFDHFGLLGLAQREADPLRLVGVALLIAGVALIRR